MNILAYSPVCGSSSFVQFSFKEGSRIFKQRAPKRNQTRIIKIVSPRGIEPLSRASEARVLSIKLRGLVKFIR